MSRIARKIYDNFFGTNWGPKSLVHLRGSSRWINICESLFMLKINKDKLPQKFLSDNFTSHTTVHYSTLIRPLLRRPRSVASCFSFFRVKSENTFFFRPLIVIPWKKWADEKSRNLSVARGLLSHNYNGTKISLLRLKQQTFTAVPLCSQFFEEFED